MRVFLAQPAPVLREASRRLSLDPLSRTDIESPQEWHTPVEAPQRNSPWFSLSSGRRESARSLRLASAFGPSVRFRRHCNIVYARDPQAQSMVTYRRTRVRKWGLIPFFPPQPPRDNRNPWDRVGEQRASRKKWTQTMQRFAKGNSSAQQEISKQAGDMVLKPTQSKIAP